MDEPASFGYWVRRRRKALDLTQAELARKLRCAVVTIQKIEAEERRPSSQIAALLAEHLRIAPDERAAFLAAARTGVPSMAEPSIKITAPSTSGVPPPR